MVEAPEMVVVEAGTVRRIPLAPHAMTDRFTAMFTLAHLGSMRAAAPDSWALTVEGLVARPLRLTLGDLAALPRRALNAVHQCAGNPLEPTVPTRRVANVTWFGVALTDVLALAGVQDAARFLWADGADSGTFAGEHVPHYRKDVPAERLAQDVLLATHLNGTPVPAAFGGPLRLVVPGFYGTNSVKWLWRLTLADRRADGLFTTRFYNDALPGGGTRPVWALAPEAIFVDPGRQIGFHQSGDATIPDAPLFNTKFSGPTDLWGWAWSDAPIVRVEISDDAARWWEASVEPRHRGRGWQRWTARWTPPRPGAWRLLCRATDADGATQPMAGARNAVHAVDVTVVERQALAASIMTPASSV